MKNAEGEHAAMEKSRAPVVVGGRELRKGRPPKTMPAEAGNDRGPSRWPEGESPEHDSGGVAKFASVSVRRM